MIGMFLRSIQKLSGIQMAWCIIDRRVINSACA
jgi:hypothetical protein